MSLTPWLPVVRKIKDGETVDQNTVNVPIDQLTQREQHLYEKFEELTGKSVLTSFGQPVHPDETLNLGELSIVYFKSDTRGAGLSKGLTGFSSSQSSSMFTPNDSNYIFGLVKTVYPQTKTADLYTEGLCELSVDLDHATYGLIQKNAAGEVEPFNVGPYFLSSKVRGKITQDPSGIPVYVGYAISKRKFLLHTNVDEFSQFFINYRYNVLDRVAGIPVLDQGLWSIASSDTSKLGWVAAADSGVTSPEGALFYYNIPGLSALLDSEAITYDQALEDSERLEASELGKYLPPVPANFIQLYQDGKLLRYNNTFDTAGIYSVNEYGLWWHASVDGLQPWADNYPEAGPADWEGIKIAVSAYRKRFFVSFSKFNPALRTQLVSSLTPYDTLVNKPSNFIKFYNKENPSETAVAGDLLVDVEANISSSGVTDNTDFTYTSTIDPAYTANRAIAALKYSKPDGEFKAVVTPIVAKIVEGSGVTISEQLPANSGVWQISATQGLVGQVDSIEPINSRLEFKELTSYIKLPVASTTPYGLIGKIVLPKGYINNRDLRLVFHMFGDVDVLNTSTNRNVALQFQYSSISALNGAAPTSYNIVNTAKYAPLVNPVEFAILPTGGYTAYTSRRVTHVDFTIPAAFVSEDSIVNFKILRVATGSTNNSYLGNVGIIATYWEIAAN
jgi:hypothetical protein